MKFLGTDFSRKHISARRGNMQDIDKTINRLCAYIQTELVLRKPKSLKQMPGLVTALAQLVEARAKLEATRPKAQDEMDISYILESITERLQQALKNGGIRRYGKSQKNTNR